jgi:hypothetical protein
MKHNRKAIFAWFLFGLITAIVVVTFLLKLASRANGVNLLGLLTDASWGLIPETFALVGALIISRQPRNVIGLLLMLPAVTLAIPVDSFLAQFATAPPTPAPLILWAAWLQNWGWLLLILPILFILLLFPTGQPPTPRWRWLIYLGVGIGVVFVLLVTFAQELGPVDADWTIRNPIGFISQAWIETYFIGPWLFSLPLLTILCAASLFVRFRRARSAEREQIKWLFYAAALFAVVYVPSFLTESYLDEALWWNVLFTLGILTVPIAIGIAILRYRLYEIDIIIRRTLQYALLTGLLGLVYFGSVVVLQSLVEKLSGQQSPIVIVISTLAIATLFSPLRMRVQTFIDRHFFRGKYDAEQTLANFAAVARDEVDVDKLTAALLGVVEQTVQPEQVSLWLRK